MTSSQKFSAHCVWNSEPNMLMYHIGFIIDWPRSMIFILIEKGIAVKSLFFNFLQLKIIYSPTLGHSQFVLSLFIDSSPLWQKVYYCSSGFPLFFQRPVLWSRIIQETLTLTLGFQLPVFSPYINVVSYAADQWSSLEMSKSLSFPEQLNRNNINVYSYMHRVQL